MGIRKTEFSYLFSFSAFFWCCSISTEVSRPPNKVTISKTTEDGVTLEWKPPSNDGGARITGYHVQAKEDTPGATWKDVGKVDGYNNRYSVTGLETGKNYKFAVLAQNENGLSEPGVADKSATPKKAISEYSLVYSFRLGCKSVCLCVCVYVCIFVCMCVCVFVHMCILVLMKW